MQYHIHYCPICEVEIGFTSRLRCPQALDEDHEVDPCNLCWEEHLLDIQQGEYREEMEDAYPSLVLLPSPSLNCLLAIYSERFFSRFNPIGDAPVKEKTYF